MSSEGAEKKPAEKESIGKFVLRMTQPFELLTQGLGVILARRMTLGARLAFADRLESLDGVGDADLVRAYMGCVSGIPVQDTEKLPGPLTEEEVARLTDVDVEDFAKAYLEHIVKPEQRDDPLRQLAEFVRAERAKELESHKQIASTISAALNVNTAAEIMKQWPDLSASIRGPISSLQKEMAHVFGPMAGIRSSLENAIRSQQFDRHSALFDAVNKTQGVAHDAAKRLNDLTSIRPPTFDQELGGSLYRAPTLPPFDQTPVGRTAIAVEELREVGQRMEDAMGYMIQQAGNVSEQMGQVLEKIEQEAGKSQKAARIAMGIGIGSLVISALAFSASAYFSSVGFTADRADARAGDKATAQIIGQLERQNVLMRAFLQDARRVPPAPASARPEGGRNAEKAAPVRHGN